ncbi:MAG TPA: hypothetical protein VGP95_16650 [Gemmatimonadaceae bacterium]|nr:hypothetical protein [Gemmatimonadaceae bacterium]
MRTISERRTVENAGAASDPLEWLLAGDPAIRWQTLRDLAGAGRAKVERERAKVAVEGWGARLLDKQGRDGTWSGGMYTPKWTSTHYTLLALRDLGVPASNVGCRTACGLILDRGLQSDGGINYPTRPSDKRRGEACISGMSLSIVSYFEMDDERVDRIADYALKEQMPDGGWNCRKPAGATHSSMNTTISMLEGLRHYELFRRRKRAEVRAAMQRGREFLLEHRLFRSHRTGAVIKSEFTRFVFPPRWHYDVLRALDHFHDVDAPRDPRLADAIALVEERRGKDGLWPLTYKYHGKGYFDMERVGAPSRWNTLRALRVLRWWSS